MPEWWCRNEKPANDNVYFENMCRVIFQAGLNWQVIDGKWPTTKKAFANFNIKKVACFTDYRRSTTPERPRNNSKQRQNQSNHPERTKLCSHRKTIRLIPKIHRQLRQIRQLCKCNQRFSQQIQVVRSTFSKPFLVYRGRKNRAMVKTPFPFLLKLYF